MVLDNQHPAAGFQFNPCFLAELEARSQQGDGDMPQDNLAWPDFHRVLRRVSFDR